VVDASGRENDFGMNFENIKVVYAANSSKFPRCTSVLIDDQAALAVIDPGAGAAALSEAFGGRRPDIIMNTHYHFDHIFGNYRAPGRNVVPG